MVKKIAAVWLLLVSVPALLWSQTVIARFDVLIKDGLVYDGTGGDPIETDVGIKGDRIVALGKFERDDAVNVIDARGLSVAPGFINMLSWSVASLIADAARKAIFVKA